MSDKQREQQPAKLKRWQQKELEEQRKFGLAPLAVDSVTGSEISPHLPQQTATAPFYYKVSGPTLAHHRLEGAQSTTAFADVVEEVVADQNAADSGDATKIPQKYRPGACRNCGSMTHKAKECTKPKKKVGAVYSNVVTGADRVRRTTFATGASSAPPPPGFHDANQQAASSSSGALTVGCVGPSTSVAGGAEGPVKKTWEQKKDSWAGEAGLADADKVWSKMEKRARSPQEGDDEDDGGKRGGMRVETNVFKAVSGDDAPATVADIDELPKYLENIENCTTLYDPRTRAMRGNPNTSSENQQQKTGGDAGFTGDNALYQTGGYQAYLEQQMRFLKGDTKSFVDFDYEIQKKNAKEKQQQQSQTKDAPDSATSTTVDGEHLTDQLFAQLYGENAAAAARPPPPSAGSSATAPTREPMPSDAVPRGEEGDAGSTDGGHAFVFGSFFDRASRRWGYKCCRSVDSHSVCPNKK